ncbi:hypothetical protein [Microbacterium sp. cx-59]|uniref:hypothetical protein n=1 Tax=Microbacterium sp. cx-59 TaxID=2891207 RepID=UPI001E44E749|nr:hypothetical protein [Microbacterium sp. cx-59]MCC4909459.1 hypothetical protein [Microbacterium sp. cx-59]
MAVETDEPVELASVQYGDFRGTAAADGHGGPVLHELANRVGLDLDRFWVVGLDIYSTRLNRSGLTIFAIDREATGISDYQSMLAFHAQHRELPVTDFLVHDISTAELVELGLKRLHVQLLSRSLPEGVRLRRTLRDDLNYAGR